MPSAIIVVDLGFGDAGKGLVTDHLTRRLGATLVVRFNGGAQAGHNVVTPDGRHHTFAQIGAGSFVPGVRTFLSSHVAIHPTALGVEARCLAEKGAPDPLSRVHASERAPVITPFHQASNRLREIARGDARHGSCGVGAGEVMADLAAAPEDALRLGVLRDPARALRALSRAQERKRAELSEVVAEAWGRPGAEGEIRVLEDGEIAARWLAAATAVIERVAVVEDSFLGAAIDAGEAVIFEGAQGVLIDEWAGFHPHTTYSTCTFENAISLLREQGYAGEVTRLGVLRAHVVRHGAGPLPTEDAALSALLPERHNQDGPWQGRVRHGYPDALLTRYATEACGGVDALALTHLDAPVWRACKRYDVAAEDASLFGKSGLVTAIPPPRARDLDRQAALGRALSRARPELEPVAWAGEEGAERAIGFFEEAASAPVRLTAWGPSASDVRER